MKGNKEQLILGCVYVVMFTVIAVIFCDAALVNIIMIIMIEITNITTVIIIIML